MISVIIPTYNAARELPATIASLMPALIEGMVRELIIIDGGSTDSTLKIADQCGATIINAREKGRGPQLQEGASAAKSQWLLFLHADTELEDDWYYDASDFIRLHETGNTMDKAAAAFTFALKDKGIAPSLLSKAVALRCALFALPYGDQGLLITKQTYENAGGYTPIPIMEDVDLIRRLPTKVKLLKARAFTSAIRYQTEGYLNRSLRNIYCLASYYTGKSPGKINEIYNGKK